MPVHDWTRVVAGNFHDFHHTWITTIRDCLNRGVLPSDYYAMAEQYADGPRPHVLALELGAHSSEATIGEIITSPSREVEGGIALADAPPKVRFSEELDDAVLYARAASHVVIRHANGDRIVAYVEIVSEGNKKSRAELEAFRHKLFEALWRGCHFLAIDIHPPGKLDPDGFHAACWEDDPGQCVVTREEPFGIASYRANGQPRVFFERVGLGKNLPDMPLFLSPSRYIYVPLELSYLRAWESVPDRWKRVLASSQ